HVSRRSPLDQASLSQDGNVRSDRNPGRVVGVWYLLLVLGGPLSLIYIPNKLFVPGDAATTAANIAAHALLFRVGMVSDLVGGLLLIFLVLAFYRLFKGVDQHLAVLLVITGGIMPALLNFVGVVYDAGALVAAQGADFLTVFDAAQHNALVMLFLRLHHYQITAAEILWGVWLFPMGLLSYKSGFVPRVIGVWLLINGAAYLALSLSGFFVPAAQDRLFMYSQPALFGELAIMLWLLIKGARPPEPAALPAPAAP
ncbi:MAG TPA: DUF4386 domain-containing protein, partial [Gemmatimonadales bacterium]